MVTSAELKKLFPTAKPGLVAAVVDGWPLAEKAGITTTKRIAEFLANIGAETGGLRLIEEGLSYSSAARIRQVWPKRFETEVSAKPFVRQPKKLAIKVYGGRMGNAPAPSTDGWDFRGGGMLQTTGREGFRNMGFEDNPAALRQPATAFATAVREWAKRGCNALADKGDTVGLRRKINGGTNGLAEVKAYRGKAMAIFEDVKPPRPAAPKVELPDTGAVAPGDEGPKIYTDKTTVEVVQRRLLELGYTEVGGVDGQIGKMTRAAILAFRDDNGLPLVPAIDQALLDALDDAKPRQLAPKREDAQPVDVREKVPEVRSNWLMKVTSFFGAIFATIAAFFDGILGNIGAASGYIQPVKDAVGDMPGWVWFVAIGLIAGGLFLIARHGEAKGVEAFKSGARR